MQIAERIEQRRTPRIVNRPVTRSKTLEGRYKKCGRGFAPQKFRAAARAVLDSPVFYFATQVMTSNSVAFRSNNERDAWLH
jgi:hypothetical protein